MTSIKY